MQSICKLGPSIKGFGSPTVRESLRGEEPLNRSRLSVEMAGSLTGYLCRHQGRLGFFSELLGLIVSCQSVDNLIERAIHDEIQLVNGQPDAMIRNAIIFEVVSADLFRAVTAAYHLASFAGNCL